MLVPFWTNFLVRTIGWQVILAPEGWLSSLLQGIGVLDGPLDLLYTRTAVIIGVVYNYLPLMILPLFVAFDRVGPALREASKDLGAGKLDARSCASRCRCRSRASSPACCWSSSR